MSCREERQHAIPKNMQLAVVVHKPVPQPTSANNPVQSTKCPLAQRTIVTVSDRRPTANSKPKNYLPTTPIA